MQWFDDIIDKAGATYDSVTETANEYFESATDTVASYLRGDGLTDEALRPASDRQLTPSSQIPDANRNYAAVGVNNDGSTVVQPTAYAGYQGSKNALPWLLLGAAVLVTVVIVTKKGGA